MVAASKFPVVAIAQSTGGSITAPASFCGICGITPTYGLVPRYGLIDYASSLDKIGAMGKTTYDAALLLSVMAGKDGKDQTSVGEKKDYTKNIGKSLKGVKVGVPKEYLKKVDPGVKEVVQEAISKLEDKGATVKETSLKMTEKALPAYYLIASAEASTNLARYCGMRYGAEEEPREKYQPYFSRMRGRYLGEEAKRRVLLGTYARMAGYRDQYYLKAMKVRTLVIKDFKEAFKKFEVLAAPAMPITAPKFSEIEGMSPAEEYAMDRLTAPSNLAGIPQMSVPVGTSRGMPVGLQILADHLQEDKMIRVGSSLK